MGPKVRHGVCILYRPSATSLTSMNGERKKQIDERLDELMQRNVEVISKLEQASQNQLSPGRNFVEAIAKFCGTMAFVYVHM